MLSKICLIVGISLFLTAVATFLLWQWKISDAEQRAKDYVQTLSAVLPESQNAVPEARRDNQMSVYSLDGTDFVGILEMPRYNSALPVAADWGNPVNYPCLFRGSIYDGTLQIGATTQGGQYDFYREISVGDTVCFTDVEGNRYSLQVTELRYESTADQTTLTRTPAALTLFLKNIYDFEYLILSCNVP